MNRQYRRATKKAEAQKRAGARPQVKPQGAPAKKERTKPRQFVREVIAELKKVAWPTRQEVIAYTMVVTVSVIVIGAIIFGMDFVFTKAVFGLFGVNT